MDEINQKDKYQETFETWNHLAALYQEKFMDLNIYHGTYLEFCKQLRNEEASILEIGCGPGNITQFLLSQNPRFKIHGIDIAPNMIALAQKNNPTAKFEVMDYRQINQLNNKYDGIIGGFCLPYLSEIECKELISNARLLLNQQGLIYLSFVEGSPDGSEFKTSFAGRVYFQYHRLETILEDLYMQGFQHIQTYKVDYPRGEGQIEKHTIIIAQMPKIIEEY